MSRKQRFKGFITRPEQMACTNKQCKVYLEFVWSYNGKCIECRTDLQPIFDSKEELLRAEFEPYDGHTFEVPDVSHRGRGRERVKSWEGPSGNGYPAYPAARYTPPKPADTFTCPDDLTTCPVAKKARLLITQDMFNTWVYLAQRFDTEWLAYLKGEAVHDQPFTWRVDDLYFPSQKATGVHVEADEGTALPGTVAAVHSHVAMDAFFSDEDVRHANWPVEVVINRNGKFKAAGRTQLECGRWHRGEADLIISRNNEADQQLEADLKAVLRRESSLIHVSH